MDTFTPIPAAIGGALIGLSAAILWLGNGRIAGISGILDSCCRPPAPSVWRLVFLAFLVGGTFVAAYLLPYLNNRPATLVEAPSWFTAGTPIWIVISGLLTGFGTRSAMAAPRATASAAWRASASAPSLRSACSSSSPS